MGQANSTKEVGLDKAAIDKAVAGLSPELREKLRAAQKGLEIKRLARAFAQTPKMPASEYQRRNVFICHAYKEGASLNQLAALFKISRATAYEKIVRVFSPPELQAIRTARSVMTWEQLTELWEKWQSVSEMWPAGAKEEDKLPPMENKIG